MLCHYFQDLPKYIPKSTKFKCNYYQNMITIRSCFIHDYASNTCFNAHLIFYVSKYNPCGNVIWFWRMSKYTLFISQLDARRDVWSSHIGKFILSFQRFRSRTDNEWNLRIWRFKFVLPSCFEFLRIIRETMQATRCRVIKPKITGSDGRLALTCPAGRPPVWSRFTSQCSKRACTLPREYKLVCLHESPRPSASPIVNNFSFTFW